MTKETIMAFLPNKHKLLEINNLVKGAHFADVIVRSNGKDIRIGADWLRYMLQYFVEEFEND